MTHRPSRLGLVFVSAIAAITFFPVSSGAQQSLPLDPNAVFKTYVPHINAPISRGAVQAPAPEIAPPVPSAPFMGSPYSVGPTVSPTTTLPEAEEHIASDPNNSATLVAAISDFSLRFGFNTTKYVFSVDNGATWRESFIPLDDIFGFFPATGDGNLWLANSDPVVAVDKLGNVYLADLYLDAIDNGNGFYVSVATLSSGVNFTVASTYAVATNPDPFTNLFEDKPWIAVDNSNAPSSGNVYASWTHFVGNSDSIVLSRSTNQGQSWSTPLQISLPAQNGAVQGSQVAVGPNGEVYVVYEMFFAGGNRQHFLAKSTNGGVSFSTPAAITPLFNELSFNATYRTNSFANLAVSPNNGNVYAVYSDQPNPTVGAEVEFIRSTNGGGTFSAPVVINDISTGQQFMPAVTADSAGVIHASWFDTRNSSGSTSLYDIFATYSRDSGGTFANNARVTPVLADADSATFIGDYAGIAAGTNTAHPVWTNGGFNNGKLQTAILTLP